MKNNLLLLLFLLSVHLPLNVNSQSLPAQAIKIPHFERFFRQPRLEIRFVFYPTAYQLSHLVSVFPQEIPFKIVLNHLTDKPVLSGTIAHLDFNYPLPHSLLNTWQELAIDLDFQTQTINIRLNQQVIIQENQLTAFTCQTADLLIGGYADLYKNYQFIGQLKAFQLNQTTDSTPILPQKTIEKPPANYLLWIAVFMSALLLGGYAFYRYQYRILTALLKQPSQFLHYPLPKIPGFYQKFHTHKKFHLLLERLQINDTNMKKALLFIKLENPLHRCNFLFKPLPCRIQPKDSLLSGLFYIEFTEEFPLNLHHLYVYFPPKTHTATQILEQLQQHCAFETALIIHSIPGVSTQQFIFIQSTELTQWLLDKNPLLSFCHLLANTMELKQLSPFQNYGAVHLRNVFLTRQPILKTLLANPTQNYALIGGRQLGKTSILKFLLNFYQTKSIDCQYLIVRDQSLLILLKSILKNKNKQLILLDEADEFIAHDRAKGYPILQQMQRLSISGKVAFIFAGHYELLTEWHSASPYRDFARPVLIEALDVDSCQPFIINSLQYLHCSFTEQPLTAMESEARAVSPLIANARP